MGGCKFSKNTEPHALCPSCWAESRGCRSVLIAVPERNSWTASELWASSDGRLKVCSANLRDYEHAL